MEDSSVRYIFLMNPKAYGYGIYSFFFSQGHFQFAPISEVTRQLGVNVNKMYLDERGRKMFNLMERIPMTL